MRAYVRVCVRARVPPGINDHSSGRSGLLRGHGVQGFWRVGAILDLYPGQYEEQQAVTGCSSSYHPHLPSSVTLTGYSNVPDELL